MSPLISDLHFLTGTGVSLLWIVWIPNVSSGSPTYRVYRPYRHRIVWIVRIVWIPAVSGIDGIRFSPLVSHPPGGKNETPGMHTPLLLHLYSAFLVEAYEPDSTEKIRKSIGLGSSIQGRKNFGFFQWEMARSHRKSRRFFDPQYNFRFPSISGGFLPETMIFLDLSDRFRSFWETGILDLGCTPLYSTRTPLVLRCIPLILRCTPLYSTRTPLLLYSYSGVLESHFFPLESTTKT